MFIYALIHPDTREVKYIGRTECTKTRLRRHIQVAEKGEKNTKVRVWIYGLLNQGKKPMITVLQECEKDWDYWEVYWIDKYRSEGADLCNQNFGGTGRKYLVCDGNDENILASLISKMVTDGKSYRSIEFELRLAQGSIAKLKTKGYCIPKYCRKKKDKKAKPIKSHDEISLAYRHSKKNYYYKKSIRKWCAVVTVDFRKRKVLGLFHTEQEAKDSVHEYRKSIGIIQPAEM